MRYSYIRYSCYQSLYNRIELSIQHLNYTGKKDRKANLGHHIENRNIGAHLVCGPIDTYVSFNTNNLVPGGANVIIEVTKRCIEVLGEMLSKRGFVTPKKLNVQYDNCGENKVIITMYIHV